MLALESTIKRTDLARVSRRTVTVEAPASIQRATARAPRRMRRRKADFFQDPESLAQRQAK